MKTQWVCLGSPLKRMLGESISRSLELETMRGTLQKWIMQHFLADHAECVSFIAKFLPIIQPSVEEEMDVPKGASTEEIVQLINERIEEIHQALNDGLDFD